MCVYRYVRNVNTVYSGDVIVVSDRQEKSVSYHKSLYNDNNSEQVKVDGDSDKELIWNSPVVILLAVLCNVQYLMLLLLL